MIKPISKSLPNIEEILLNEKIPFYKITVNRKSIFDSKKQTLRWYVPNWNKIINEGILFDLLIERKKLRSDQRNFHYKISQVYLLLTYAPTKRSKRETLTGRRARTFNIDTLLFNPVYNEELHKLDYDASWRIKHFVRELSKSKKENQLNEIFGKKISKFLDKHTPIAQLITKAFYEKELTLPLSKMGDEYFTTFVIDKSADILNKVFNERDLETNPLTQEEFRSIRKNILPDPIIDELRGKELNPVLEKLELLYGNFMQIVQVGTIDNKNKSAIDNNGYLTIVQEMIDVLSLLKKRKFNEIKKLKLEELIDDLVQMKNLPDADKWKGLISIRDRFYDTKDSLLFLLNKLEVHLKNNLINFSKLVFEDLVTQENLNQAEKRLYIISNIGLSSYNHTLPIFDNRLLDFFHLNKFNLQLFIEVVLNKNLTYDKIDLKEYLEYQFRIFLAFYPFWHDELKSSEREIKKMKREKKSTKVLDTSYDKDKNAPNPIDLFDTILLEEGIQKICNKREIKVYFEKVIHNKTLVQIAKEQNVSPQMISKIYQRAKKNIHKFYARKPKN